MSNTYQTIVLDRTSKIKKILATSTVISLFPRSKEKILKEITWSADEQLLVDSFLFDDSVLPDHDLDENNNKQYQGYEDMDVQFPFKVPEYSYFMGLRKERRFINLEKKYTTETVCTKKMTLFFLKTVGNKNIFRHLLSDIVDRVKDLFDDDVCDEFTEIMDDIDTEDVLKISLEGQPENTTLLYNDTQYNELNIRMGDLLLAGGMKEIEIISTAMDNQCESFKVVCQLQNADDLSIVDLLNLELKVVTNKLVTDIETIADGGDLWIYPGDDEQEEKNDGIKKLQYICNQVVSRRKGFNYEFLDENGIFDKKTKDALEQFTTYFSLLNSKSFPYLEHALDREREEGALPFGPDKAWTDYFSSEYGMSSQRIKGMIVDKRLLIGDDESRNNLEETDGLLDLYENVVIPFQNKFVERAMEYVNNTKPWFANPGQSFYYQMGEVTLQSEKVLYKEDEDTPVTDTQNNNITIPQNRKVQPLQEDVNKQFTERGCPKPGKYLISYNNAGTSIRGRVELTKEDLDNRQDDKDCNKGNYSQSESNDFINYGVPYTLAGKLPLDEFNKMPDPTGDIYNWSRYELQNPRKPKTGDNSSTYGDVYNTNKYDILDSYKIAGIDCSGLIKRCLKETCFENTKTSIFPFSKIHLNENYGASSTPVLSRTVPSKTQERVRKGDVLWKTTRNGSHVTIVHGNGEPDKDLRTGDGEDVAIDSNTFQIVHAFGGGGNKVNSLQDKKDSFLGKTIKTPIGKGFWSNYISVNLVRIYLWI